ncbi:Spc24 subunit of Ndc80-domain-containing protein [Lipomyces oligophaga]|uniref:Spc24 subunit of Ndc80-domain-containing protein n=1 Tax=Lipomyces oligophaga TaxID=45792 RepID=UPI0034CFDAEA
MALVHSAGLLSTTIDNFQIEPDVHSLLRISDHIRILNDARTLEQEQWIDVLRALSRHLELSKAAAEAQETREKSTHTDTLISLDREKFTLAKSINELEASLHDGELTLNRLLEESVRLQTDEDLFDTSPNHDSVVLLLKLYRSLGLSLEPNQTGGYSKVIVRSLDNTDMHVLSLERNYSLFFTANFLWEMM